MVQHATSANYDASELNLPEDQFARNKTAESEATLLEDMPTTTTTGASDLTLPEDLSDQISTTKVCWSCCVCLPDHDQSKVLEIRHKLEKMTEGYIRLNLRR